jgi:hypothetical protein
MGSWTKLHSEELHDFNSSSDIVDGVVDKWTEHVAHIGKMRSVYTILIGKPETPLIT